MDSARRIALVRAALEGYVHGPLASLTARDRALDEVEGARAIVFVEGISDQIALETSAARLGHNLDSEHVRILPAGGAQEMAKLLVELGRRLDRGVRLAGLCDAAEEPVVRSAMCAADLGEPATRAEMEALGFFVCVEDLEHELIRAAGVENTLAVIDSQGDLSSFEKLQLQPAWRERPVERQLRRFMGSGARRKLRYARLLAGSIDISRIPRPIAALAAHI